MANEPEIAPEIAPEEAILEGRPFYGLSGVALEAAKIVADEGGVISMYFTQWDSLAEWQMSALEANGLRPESRLLDIGSGMLRLGVKAITYLDDGKYFGIEAYDLFVRLSHVIAERLNLGKTYTLLLDDEFSFHKFETKFDFAIAQSVFTHLSVTQIHDCVRKLKGVMESGGVFVFTSTVGKPRTLGFLYGGEVPMQRPAIPGIEFYQQMADEHGLAFEQPVQDHPTKQFVGIFRFP